MKHWINFDHLQEAGATYTGHFVSSMEQAITQFLLMIGSIIHAVFPFLFGFKLLEIVVAQAIKLHRFVPEHPAWKELKQELADDNKR
jgi:hypothetical protein